MTIRSYSDLMALLDDNPLEDGGERLDSIEMINEFIDHFEWIMSQFGIVLSNADIKMIANCFLGGIGKTAILRILFDIYKIRPDQHDKDYWHGMRDYVAEYCDNNIAAKIKATLLWLAFIVIQEGIIDNTWTWVRTPEDPAP